jgi:Retrotransposon gag protein
VDPDGQDLNNEQCWNEFNTVLTRKFRDATEREVVLRSMLALRQQDDHLEKYISQFNTLRKLVDWDEDDKGTIWQFHCGLKEGLHRSILDKDAVLPTTLQEWQEAVLKHHGRWLKTKAALGDYSPFRHPQSQRERWAAALGRPQ